MKHMLGGTAQLDCGSTESMRPQGETLPIRQILFERVNALGNRNLYFWWKNNGSIIWNFKYCLQWRIYDIIEFAPRCWPSFKRFYTLKYKRLHDFLRKNFSPSNIPSSFFYLEKPNLSGEPVFQKYGVPEICSEEFLYEDHQFVFLDLTI